MHLHNIYSKDDLLKIRKSETFARKTVSFYRYVLIDNPQEYRDILYKDWSNLGVLGRVYIASEGINAQINIPEHNVQIFFEYLNSTEYFKNMPLKWAVEEATLSFLKLKIKVRHKIVADGLPDNSFDVTNVGTHLTAIEFNNALELPNSVVIDMRNFYESEIGHFENALCPDVDTFREEVEFVEELLKGKEDKKILLYCTGGVRCEKASAYFKHKGYKDVNQLYGGIIEYARQVKEQGIESKFKGKNFVFDERLGERITADILSSCHQCGKPCDTHTNCANDDCHLLFIQCSECAAKFNACCCFKCKDIIELPKETRKKLRAEMFEKYSTTKIFKSRLRPRLK